MTVQTSNNDDNFDDCLNQAGENLAKCTVQCESNNDCRANCQNVFDTEYQNCPCQASRIFYSRFSNIKFVYPFQDNCKLGCPCDNYDCRIPRTFSVLTLSTHKTSNYPSLIKYNGGKRT